MNFFYENQGTSKYLVYEFEENEKVDSLSLCMLTNNRIEGVVPLFYTQADDSRFIKYNISAKVSLKQYFADTVNKEQVLKVIKGIVSSILTSEEYMLDSNSLLLNEEYIFVDASRHKVWMTYLPSVKPIEDKEDVETFLKRIIFGACYDQRENSDYIAELISYLNRKQGFLISEFKELIERLMNGDNMNCLSIPETNNRAIITELPNNEDEILSDTVFDAEDTVLVNNNSDDNYWHIETGTVMAQLQDIMTLRYLITHYSKENRLKFREQRRKAKNTYIENQERLENQKQNFMFSNRMFTTVGGKVELIKRSF